MDTNVINALIVALTQEKAVAPASASLQIVTITLAALSPVLTALAVYLVRLAQKEIAELKENVDGKMTKLLEVTSRAAREEGKTEQRAENALVEQARAQSVIEQLKAKTGSTAQPDIVHQIVSQEISEQNVDSQIVEETLRKTPPKKI